MILTIDGRTMADYFNGLVEELDNQFGCGLSKHKIDTSPQDFERSYDLPGFKKDEIKVTFIDNLLNIETNSKTRGMKRFGANLPAELYDHDRVSAKFEDGVLRVSVPLKTSKKAEPKVVTVQ